jgi:hypothetical protein
MNRPLNPRVQRTPSASPPSLLSRQPSGGAGFRMKFSRASRHRHGLVLAAIILVECRGKQGAEPIHALAETSVVAEVTADPVFRGRVSEISLQRGGCYGTCPVYSITLRSDGSARYRGIRYVDRSGEYSGKYRFSELGTWLESQDKLLDRSEDLPVAIDGERVALTLVLRDGRLVSKRFGTGSGRRDLWVAAEVVDGISSKVRWEKVTAK